METTSSEERELTWCLETTDDGGKTVRRILIKEYPFRIGRLEGLDLTLPFQSVSKRHAEIFEEGEDLMLRDMGSTNGTFVNRERVTGALLRQGDIIHFAEFEFRLGRHADGGDDSTVQIPQWGTVALDRVELSEQFIGGTRQLSELLDEELTDAHFQPIVEIPSRKIVGYEVLGRGCHEELPASPIELFRIAHALEREDELSRLFRKRAIERVKEHGVTLPLLFLNTHPSEVGEPELLDSLGELREILPEQPFALEIHEGVLAHSSVIKELKGGLDEIEIQLALDDFGVGERFLQLANFPPDYLKFDITVVKEIVDGSTSTRRMLAMLMAAARELGAHSIAEGIESEREASVCADVGFRLAQGYLYAETLPLETILDIEDSELKRDDAADSEERSERQTEESST